MNILSDLFRSKKFVVTLLAVIFQVLVQLLAKVGIVIDSTLTTTITALLGAYVVSQGLADSGKEAAKVNAAAAVLSPERTATVSTAIVAKAIEVVGLHTPDGK